MAHADEPRRCLVVSAHPDDIEFGAAGTVAGWVDDGWHVTYCIVTRGEKGSHADDDPVAYGQRRAEEARVAAAAVGVEDLQFLDWIDGEVVHGLALLRDLARVFRQTRPHRVLTMIPEQLPGGGFINHPDHRAVGEAMLDVILAPGTTAGWFPELARDEGLAPWRGCEDVWLMGPGQHEHLVDITATIDRKIEALRAHASQMRDMDPDVRIREMTARIGASAGLAHAEGFRRLDLRR